MKSFIAPPKLIYFTPRNDNRDDSRKMWEIGVPGKNSLFWSIIMAYLTTPIVPDIHELRQRIQRMIGNRSDIREAQKRGKKLNLRLTDFSEVSLKKRLQNFNPFKNRHTFYFDEEMKALLPIFKWQLNRFSNGIKTNIPFGNERKLEGASRMLSCSIEICYFENGVERYAYFPKEKKATSAHHIVLFHREDGDVKKFTFGMNIISSNKLQKLALSFILKKANISIEPHVEDQLFDTSQIFILNVLEHMKPTNIMNLYRSPYIALKLFEAGFETNPLAEDSNGVSAFSHALRKGNEKVCRILYDSAVNSHWLSGSCVRNPDECIVESLQLIKNAMEKDSKIFEDSEVCSEIAKEIFHAYSRFNEFQLKFAQKAVTLKDEKNKFLFRKNFTLALLECFEEFSYNNSSSDSGLELQNFFDDYKIHSIYNEILDSFTCILFFDSLHNLLENIPLKESTLYCDINFDFLLLTLCNKNFVIDPNFRSRCKIKAMSKQYISLIFKTNLSFKFRELSGKLQSITKAPETAEKTDIDKFYRKALTDAPQMKDEIILSKVKSYLESNSRLVLHQDASDEEKTTAVLTIQRIIQILGESLKPSVTENCVVSYLLCSCLPLGWEESFTKARNFLSHLKGNSIQVRFKTEKDLELFMEIQKQLSVINTNFEIVYLFQKQRINKFFLRCGLEAKQNFSVQYDDQLKELDHEYTPKYIQLLKRYINYLKFCIDTCYYIKLSKSFGNKFLVLCGLIKNIQEYSHESSSNFLIHYEKCHEMLSLLQAKESLNCSRHEKPTISDTIKEFKNVLCTLENSIDHVFPLHEIQNFSDDLNSIIEVYLEKSINIQNFVEDEKMSIIKMAEHIYEEMKSTLKVTTTSKEIQKNELEKLLPSFIFDQKLIQKVKLNVKDTKTIGIALEKCCFAWHTLKSNLENFLDKNVLEHRGCRMLLLKVCSPVSGLDRNLKKKLFDIMNQKMEFLFKRIHFIKQILIDQDGEISHYFQWGRTLGLKYHTKYLMVQRYRKDMEVRASLEMLLFDCSNLFKRKDLEDLWKKTEHLLAGINIGDILAHGNVVLDTIGTMLDPNDLPNELVEKMIELVKDGELISEMLKFFKGKDWYESKEAFRDALTQKEIFRECPRLDSYIELLPYP